MINILIADPNSASSKALRLLLQRELPSVVTTHVWNVEGLIRALTETSYDVLLLDWGLYASPAPETARLLHKAYPHLKVVLLSADANDACTARAVNAFFIHKDAQPAELMASLHSIVPAGPQE